MVGFFIDLECPKTISFDKINELPCETKYRYRKESERFINISAINISIDNQEKDIKDFTVKISNDLQSTFIKAEEKEAKRTLKEEAKKKKKNKGKTILAEDNRIKFNYSQYSKNIDNDLVKIGYTDTLNKVFTDDYNTLTIEGAIRKINRYAIMGHFFTRNGDACYKIKLNMDWYIKNCYGEILDSINTNAFSGDYLFKENNFMDILLTDASEVSFLNLLENSTFQKHLKQDDNLKISDNLLTLNRPLEYVQDKKSALDACVSVKRKGGGHGSGFAITNDGYILTNFHVIAGDKLDQPEELKIILSDGSELKAQVVRYNRMRDIALLKIDTSFAQPFNLSNSKTFTNSEEVYTIGAPKSIELGQSVSRGILSNERNHNNFHMLQLNMSVNGGNSGGALFSSNGNLHGVITSKLVGFATEGVSFAIPAYLIADYLNISFK